MDELIQKYLDGDLSDGEAREFNRRLAGEPELEAELKSYERMLVLASRSRNVNPSLDFTDQVMDRIAAGAPRPVYGGNDRSTQRRWLPRLAWAAGFAAVFVLGFATAGRFTPRPLNDVTPEGSRGSAVGYREAGAVTPGAAEVPFRVVRLVYVPQDNSVESVSVAGTFNGWDPEGTTMRREGGVWVVQLMLPPQTYEYMFVENGQQWVTDPLATQTRDDGFGRRNAVLDLTI
jgi:anti-sigma factor RsiW